MADTPFVQRTGIDRGKPIDDDFPMASRIALGHLVLSLIENNYVSGPPAIFSELFRTGRFTGREFEARSHPFSAIHIIDPLIQMEWHRAYAFCERVYGHLLISHQAYDGDIDDFVEVSSLQDAQLYFSDGINLIMSEDNIAFQFIDGSFQRRGRAHTQAGFQRVGSVLSNPLLVRTRHHYVRARRFFDERPQPDVTNCIKEAICALEDCVQALTKKSASNDFSKAMKQLQGLNTRQIHPAIADGIIRLHAYRGSGRGIAHAAPDGSAVSELDAELVLNLVASYITYFVDLFPVVEDDVPF